MLAKGGKNFYGIPIGILMNESSFPRVPGEMGNAWTWDFPVLYKVVKLENKPYIISAVVCKLP